MRSIERVFNKVRKENPYLSDYICFAEAVEGRNFSRQTIARYFNKLVDKDDYNSKEKKELLQHLFKLSQGNKKAAEDNQK